MGKIAPKFIEIIWEDLWDRDLEELRQEFKIRPFQSNNYKDEQIV